MNDYDLDLDELTPAPREARKDCTECGREWRGPLSEIECPDCHSAGGRPGTCFQCGGPMRWVVGHEAECSGCDARYPLAAIRTYRLGQLVERLVAESRTGSAEEVGRMILAAGRPALRRVK